MDCDKNQLKKPNSIVDFTKWDISCYVFPECKKIDVQLNSNLFNSFEHSIEHLCYIFGTEKFIEINLGNKFIKIDTFWY